MADDVAVRVGRTIKTRREQLGLSLRALAAKSGVSASMISDIERGAKSPTISILAGLADALEVPVSDLVDTTSPLAGRIKVVRRSEQPALVDPASGAKRTSFGPPVAGSRIEFLSYLVPPRVIAGPFAAHAAGTIEHVHLAAGRLRVELGNEVVSLQTGDSCSCRADVPHRFDNSRGKVKALIYLVVEHA
jgi:transcriptional regulator with XRE-family HTH domain